jgi:hypothetical protein
LYSLIFCLLKTQLTILDIPFNFFLKKKKKERRFHLEQRKTNDIVKSSSVITTYHTTTAMPTITVVLPLPSPDAHHVRC